MPILNPTRLSTTPRQDPISVQPQELGSDPSSRRVVDSNAIGSTGQQRQKMVILPGMALDESSGSSATRPAATPEAMENEPMSNEPVAINRHPIGCVVERTLSCNELSSSCGLRRAALHEVRTRRAAKAPSSKCFTGSEK
ncbi:hypothetical protein V6N11_020729 [Hibiscus sabdariffa]|uniref:Uncharacterized protein n=1 Tax=Hibiscus sabdariffa TaxID=183260 RepID=A0ABR2Q9S3_9ROSI